MSSASILTKQELREDQKYRVYMFCRPTFSGSNATIRKYRNIAEIIGINKPFMRPMLLEFSPSGLVDILRDLLERDIFSSEARAREEFPTHFSGHVEPQASETTATRSASEACSTSATSEASSVSSASEACSASAASKVAPSADAQSAAEAPSQIAALKSGLEMSQASQDTGNGVPQPADNLGSSLPTVLAPVLAPGEILQPSANDITMPTGSPDDIPPLVGDNDYIMRLQKNIPYRVQHTVLTQTQTLLEECFYNYASKHMPGLVRGRGWDCPAAGELTEWIVIFRRKQDLPFLLGPHLLRTIADLRHTAVHRRRVRLARVLEFLESAILVAQRFKDRKRAAQISTFHLDLKSKFKAKVKVKVKKTVEPSGSVQEMSTSEKIEEAQNQHKELDKPESQVPHELAHGKSENQSPTGALVESSAQPIFNTGNTLDGEGSIHDGEHTMSGLEHTVSDGEHVMSGPEQAVSGGEPTISGASSASGAEGTIPGGEHTMSGLDQTVSDGEPTISGASGASGAEGMVGEEATGGVDEMAQGEEAKDITMGGAVTGHVTQEPEILNDVDVTMEETEELEEFPDAPTVSDLCEITMSGTN